MEQHFHLSRPYLHHNIPQSKTDPFRRGCTIRIYHTKSSTCPYHALKRYQKLIGEVTPSNSLYEAGRFHPLSRTAVTNSLCQLLKQVRLNYTQYSSHNFRIGAATTAAAAGLPVWLIKNLGRWSSNAYRTYIH